MKTHYLLTRIATDPDKFRVSAGGKSLVEFEDEWLAGQLDDVEQKEFSEEIDVEYFDVLEGI